MKEDRQGIEIIEKTRWEGDKAVGIESENKDEERNERKESLKRNKI